MSLLEDLKTQYRTLEKKEERIAVQFAKRLNLPWNGEPFWVMKQSYLDDPLCEDLNVQYRNIMDEMNTLYWEIAELEHDKNNPRMDYIARKRVNDFLNDLGNSYDVCDFLKELGMTTHQLIEEVSINPHFMDGAFL